MAIVTIIYTEDDDNTGVTQDEDESLVEPYNGWLKDEFSPWGGVESYFRELISQGCIYRPCDVTTYMQDAYEAGYKEAKNGN